MLGPLSTTIQGVVNFTWPMILISCVILISYRIIYMIKNHIHFTLYRELLTLSFAIYIMCLFQVVTFQDDVTWSTNNFIPFQEIFRYSIGSRLFFKNVLGNMIMFLPYGFFMSYYLKLEKPHLCLLLTIIASFSIEIVQMSIGRVFDIDDIILNILGGLFGFYIFHILDRIGNKLPKILKNEYFLDFLSLIVLIGIIVLIGV